MAWPIPFPPQAHTPSRCRYANTDTDTGYPSIHTAKVEDWSFQPSLETLSARQSRQFLPSSGSRRRTSIRALQDLSIWLRVLFCRANKGQAMSNWHSLIGSHVKSYGKEKESHYCKPFCSTHPIVRIHGGGTRLFLHNQITNKFPTDFETEGPHFNATYCYQQ